MMCNHCQENPCHRVVHGQMLRGAGFVMDVGIPPNTARRTLYRTYIGAVHGYLDRGNRVVVPICARDFIREMLKSTGDTLRSGWMNFR